MRRCPSVRSRPWPDDAVSALETFWTARIAGQREIDASIAAKAEHVVIRETIRIWMIADGLWLSRAQRRRFHRPRLRREGYGELIQIDGSDHRWFEDRGPPCTLLVFIDDATSR